MTKMEYRVRDRWPEGRKRGQEGEIDNRETNRRTDGREKGVIGNDGIFSISAHWWLTYKRQ